MSVFLPAVRLLRRAHPDDAADQGTQAAWDDDNAVNGAGHGSAEPGHDDGQAAPQSPGGAVAPLDDSRFAGLIGRIG